MYLFIITKKKKKKKFKRKEISRKIDKRKRKILVSKAFHNTSRLEIGIIHIDVGLYFF